MQNTILSNNCNSLRPDIILNGNNLIKFENCILNIGNYYYHNDIVKVKDIILLPNENKKIFENVSKVIDLKDVEHNDIENIK